MEATSSLAIRSATSLNRRVIIASSFGTIFEVYDFYLAGSLAVMISRHIFAGANSSTAFILTLASFAAGFAVRPLGGIFFGRLGDLVGRKHTFLLTILLMGIATFAVGILPGYESIGIWSPIIFIALRMLQGLAIGGEFGGAAIYVAEHAPPGKRGAWTSYIQTTATLSLFLSMVVIYVIRRIMGEEAFSDWGWRVPFLSSCLLLGISVWMRLMLQESPIFVKMQSHGQLSKAPIAEAFGNWKNIKLCLIALFGLVAGQAVILYTGQLYTLFFLTQTLKVDGPTANLLIGAALLLGTPFFVVFGTLSDRIGRKPIMMAGCALAAILYFPLFFGLTHYVNPALEEALVSSPIEVIADPDDCSFQFNPIGTTKITSSCDTAKAALAKAGLNYKNRTAITGALTQVHVGGRYIDVPANTGDVTSTGIRFSSSLAIALSKAGYPTIADRARINWTGTILILVALVLLITMVFGPLSAMMVEMFPARIRYTAMSLPYHLGNGWFGGFLPATAFAIVAQKGNIYAGLWYPVSIAAMTFLIGSLFLKETKGTSMD